MSEPQDASMSRRGFVVATSASALAAQLGVNAAVSAREANDAEHVSLARA